MRWQQRQEYVPGTTSRASIASLYSMKPKPFMSLISVISPVPWVLKWFSTSALVATVHAVQSANSVELSEGPQKPRLQLRQQWTNARGIASQCRVARRVRVRQKRGADAVQKWRRGSENKGQPRPHPRFLGMACSARVSCCACALEPRQGKREVGVEGHIRESSKKRTVAREVAKVEALCREYVR